MTKEELLRELRTKISTNEMSREEVLGYLNVAVPAPIQNKPDISSHFSITKILYVLGAIIVVVGVLVFVSEIWDDIGSLGRILVTLGVGLLFAAIGTMLYKEKPDDSIGTIFHFIGGLLIPGGAMVTLSEFSTGQDPSWPMAITIGLVFLFYVLLNVVHKKPILTFFTIANGTATVYLLLNAVLQNSYETGDIYEYLTMAVGISYLVLAHDFREGWNKALFGVLCFFGPLAFLGASFSKMLDSGIWEFLFVLFVMGAFFLSIHLKSKNILIVSTLFLIAYVVYITNEYFADSLSWPVILVFLGLFFIGLGYVSININKKYIAQ